MKVTCNECDQEIPYRKIETHTVFNDGEFTTIYRCPHCQTQIENVDFQ